MCHLFLISRTFKKKERFEERIYEKVKEVNDANIVIEFSFHKMIAIITG